MIALRYRVLRLLDARENARTADTPTIGDVAEGMGLSTKDVALVLKSSEAMGMVAIRRHSGATAKDYSVILKSPAYVYLESHPPESMPSERDN
jgi:DNA-binding MarR family transcriptional regulator